MHDDHVAGQSRWFSFREICGGNDNPDGTPVKIFTGCSDVYGGAYGVGHFLVYFDDARNSYLPDVIGHDDVWPACHGFNGKMAGPDHPVNTPEMQAWIDKVHASVVCID